MTNALIAAAQAVVDRWDTPAWKDVEHTAAFINRLRAALATAAGVVKESLTAAHALPPGIARDDTVHGEMYYTAEQVRAMLAQAAPAAAAATPTAASIAWTALRDLTDPLGEAGVKIMGHVRIYAQRQYEAGLTEGRATPPAQAADSVLEDVAFEEIHKKLCALPRYSFFSDGYGAVRRAPDKYGSWIAFNSANELFDTGAIDAARKEGGA